MHKVEVGLLESILAVDVCLEAHSFLRRPHRYVASTTSV